MKLICTATDPKTPSVLIAIKKLLWISLFAFTFVSARAAWPQLPGEYEGLWTSRDPYTGRTSQGPVRMVVSSRSEVVLWVTLIDRITGTARVRRTEGIVLRSGTVRGRDPRGSFRVVRQGKYGGPLRGVWYQPVANGRAYGLPFNLEYKGPYVPPEEDDDAR